MKSSGARRRRRRLAPPVADLQRLPGRWSLVAVPLVLLATSTLQGCDVPRVEGYFDVTGINIPTHGVASWRQSPDYYDRFAHVDSLTNTLTFNSCMDPSLGSLDVCNGRGHCAPFDRYEVISPVFFCKCDHGWGDPECGTRRKLQSTAWLLALFCGPLGAQNFYLGWYPMAVAQLLTSTFGLMLVIFGFRYFGTWVIQAWWIVDVVRVGSGPVRAHDFRVSHDLPNWTFAVFTLLFFSFLGFVWGLSEVTYAIYRRRHLQDYRAMDYKTFKTQRPADQVIIM